MITSRISRFRLNGPASLLHTVEYLQDLGVPLEKIRFLPFVGHFSVPEMLWSDMDERELVCYLNAPPEKRSYLRLRVNVRPDNRLAWLFLLLQTGLPSQSCISEMHQSGETWVERTYRIWEEGEDEQGLSEDSSEPYLGDSFIRHMLLQHPHLNPEALQEFVEVLLSRMLLAVVQADRLGGFEYDPRLKTACKQVAILGGLNLTDHLSEAIQRKIADGSYLGVDQTTLESCELNPQECRFLIDLIQQRYRNGKDRLDIYTRAVHGLISPEYRVSFAPFSPVDCCLDSPVCLLDFSMKTDGVVPALHPCVILETVSEIAQDLPRHDDRLDLIRRLFLPAHMWLHVTQKTINMEAQDVR
jgi:hypothetical protein